MAITPTVLYSGGQLSTLPSTLVTSPTGTRVVITHTVFTNVESAARALSVWIVRAGAQATDANIAIDALSLAAGQSYVPNEIIGAILGAGDMIQAAASMAASITCAGIDGAQIT